MSGVSITKPNGIELFRLISLKGAMGLEAKGIYMSRGVRLRPMWAEKLGLKPRDSYEKFLAAIEARIKATEEKGDLGIESF